MFGKLLDSVCDTVGNAINDPIGTAVKAVTQPIEDSFEVLTGLTEGELRHKAALRLGVDVVAGMAVNEIIESLAE